MASKKLGAALGAIALMLTACGGSGGEAGGSAGEPIRIGGAYSVSGAFATLGVEANEGAEAYVKCRNDSGGVLGRPLELVSIDTASDPQVVLDAVQRLADRDGVVGIVGPEGTPTTIAAIQASRTAQVPIISNGGSWPFGQTPEQLEWVFSTTPPTQQIMDGYVEWWTKRGDVKTFAVIGADTPFLAVPRQWYEAKKDFLAVKMVAFVPFPPGAVDPVAEATTIRDANPDFIISWSSGPDQATALRTLSRLGVDVPIGMNGGVTSDVFGRIAGPELLAGKYAATYPPESLEDLPADYPLTQTIKEYTSCMQTAGFDSKSGASSAYLGYDAVASLVQGIETAGSVEPHALRNALETQTYVGASAVYKRTPQNHNGAQGINYNISENANGAWSLVHLPTGGRS
ncbi:MAG: hypothetical protein ABS81_06155 [Pseudonocardia sp. SCN 72-86]|nr:MAG: hypothetical protein ABS81_06155 [Pseudonocardia sp. SCN 72-86]